MSVALVRKVVKIMGSQAALANEMGTSRAYITSILRSGVVPAGRCRHIEALTKGEVTAEQLRPDVFDYIEIDRPIS